MVTSKKNVSKVNQKPEETSSYIVLEFTSYQKFVLPIEEGTSIIKALAKAKTIEHKYGNEADILHDTAQRLYIEYMSQEELNRIAVRQLIEPDQ
jgi:hypothetical protein